MATKWIVGIVMLVVITCLVSITLWEVIEGKNTWCDICGRDYAENSPEIKRVCGEWYTNYWEHDVCRLCAVRIADEWGLVSEDELELQLFRLK